MHKIIKETLSNNKVQYRVMEGCKFFNLFTYGWINSHIPILNTTFKTIEPGAAVFNTLEEAKQFCLVSKYVYVKNSKIVAIY